MSEKDGMPKKYYPKNDGDRISQEKRGCYPPCAPV